jgi:hypothetical protein
MLDALDLAAKQLNASLTAGNGYRIDGPSTFSSAARTISGVLRISRHTYGTAFDINSRRNPYRKNNVLETDLPDWWVQSFLDAGFCWGGLWIGSKDAMHFAWQGPAFSGATELPPSYEPLTTASPFAVPAASIHVVPEEDPLTLGTLLADADGNGAIDIVRLVDIGSDLAIDVSLASRRHNACSSRRSIVAGAGNAARSSVAMGFGDMDGRGGQDLWMATDENGLLRFTVRWAFGGYAAETSVATRIPTPSGSGWISTGDFNVDGAIDVFMVDRGRLQVWSLDPNNGDTSPLFSGDNPFPDAEEYFLGDFDLDHRPDLWAIRRGSVSTALAKDDYRLVLDEHVPLGLPGNLQDVRAADYDGDGRVDLITFDGISKQVWLGNTRLPDGLPLEVWFEYADPECEDDEKTWDRQELNFSTSTWIAEGAFAWRSRNGLPVGCDPSDDDCEAQRVTRQMFVEFLAWVDGLDSASGNTLNGAGWVLVDAGYKVPCTMDDTRCWSQPMPRAELASLFGQFLAKRRGDVPEPHRWIGAQPPRGAIGHYPR